MCRFYETGCDAMSVLGSISCGGVVCVCGPITEYVTHYNKEVRYGVVTV